MDHLVQSTETLPGKDSPEIVSPLSERYRHRSQVGIFIGCALTWLAASWIYSMLDSDSSALLWHLSSLLTALAPTAWLVMVPYFWIADTRKGFCFTGTEVIYRSGWLCPSKMTIPFKRIQHIEVKQGLLDRPFGLHRLVILPAGKGIVIPGLSGLIAEQLRTSLLQRIGVEDEE